MSRTEIKFRIRINWPSAQSGRPSTWTPTLRDESDLHIQPPKCSGWRNDLIPKLYSHAGNACKSDQLDPLELGSRFKRARLPRARPASGTATRPRRKTTRFGTDGRVGERGGAPPAERLRRASTAALPGFAAKRMSPILQDDPFFSRTRVFKIDGGPKLKSGTPPPN